MNITLTYIIPRNYPANISNPVEYDSSIGYVTSTPSSKPTAIIGIIENPMIKQQTATRVVLPEVKEKEVAIVLNIERAEIIITESL
jgi:hypothetical protein